MQGIRGGGSVAVQPLVGEPWIRYRDTTLYAVPSIHNRLIFAQLVLEACRRRRFDVIAVELPASLDRGWLQRIADVAPAIGLLVDAYGPRTPLEVTSEDEIRPRRVSARRGVAIPITPADSIVTALRCPQLLAAHWRAWRPEVIAIDTNDLPATRPRSPLRIVDDYEVMVRGLAAFQERWTDAWQSGRVDPLDDMRERAMASRLARFVEEGREVLFVCGAAHWQPVARLLDADLSGLATRPPAPSPHVRARALHVVSVDPSSAWLSGWLDDIPSVVWEHERACAEGTASSWDKRDATARLLAAALERAHQDHRAPSPRRLAKMARYQHVLLAAAGRWTPELDEHLAHSAETCVSPGFARRLKELALEYAGGAPDQSESVHLLRAQDGRPVLRVGDEYFLFEPADPDVGSGRRLPLPRRRLTAAERAVLERTNCVYRDWPAEQALHNRLIAHARRLAHNVARDHIVRPFSAGLGHGIAMRQTLDARTRGRPDLFVKFPKPRRLTRPVCDGLCPVVWIFDATSPVTDTFSGYVPRQAHSHAGRCFSAFYWLKGSRVLGESRIRQLSVAYTVSLMRGLMPAGRQRRASTVSAIVSSFPVHRRATVAPWNDTGLRAFRGCDLAVACGVKYAGDHVIVVSSSSHAIGAGVAAFARDRGVRVIRLSRENFAADSLERLGLDHNVPAPSHWGPPFDWCARFMPDAEANDL